MRFLSISLQGFKKYLEHTFMFGKGLNVLVGPNEAGKTTLHQGIITALYGFGRRSAQLLRNREEARNWHNQSTCQLDLEFTLADGQYLIQRDLERGEVILKVFDEHTKQFVTYAEDAKKIEEFIAQTTGIPSPEVFNQTISVRQNQLAAVTDLAGVGTAIEAIFTGEEKTSVAKVLDRLQAVRKSLRKRPREKPGRLDELEERLQEVNGQLGEATAFEDQRRDLSDKVQKLRTSLPQEKQRLAELEDLLKRAEQKRLKEEELARLRERYSEIDAVLKQIEKQEADTKDAETAWARYAQIDKHAHSIDEFRSLATQLQDVAERRQKEEDRLAAERQKMVVLVQNTSIFLSPKALVPALLLLIGGGAAALLLANWLYLILSLVGLVWAGLTIWKGGGRSYKITDVPSEALVELRNEEKEKHARIMKLVADFGIDPEIISNHAAINDFFHAYAQAKERVQVARASLEAVIAKKDQKALRQERERVAFDGQALKAGLEPLLTFQPKPEDIRAWEEERSLLERALPLHEADCNQAQGRLDQMQESGIDVTALAGEKEYLTEEIKELTRKHAAVELALEVLERVVSEYRAEHIPEMEKQSSTILKQITAGAYPKLDIVSSWPEIHVPLGNNQQASHEQLSQGTIDQVFFALRLAAADMMSREVQLPLLLDDPFVNFDDERYRLAIGLMGEIAKTRQVLYFTSRRHIHDDLKQYINEHDAVHVITLQK